MCYVHWSLDNRLVGYIGDNLSGVRPHLYTDADLAGCPDTQRSTSGVYHCIKGPHTSFPIAVVSKRQGCVSHSTPEAELVALDHGLQKVAIPSTDIWELLLPDASLTVHEDNDVAIRVCQTGKNQTMRQLGRTHGICIAFLHECYISKRFSLVYEPSCTMAADIFTKSFSNPEAWQAVCWLVSVCHKSDIAVVCNLGDSPPPQSQGGTARKLGEWSLNPDGSGTWTRYDTTDKGRTLRKGGPLRQEVHLRETFCAETGQLLESLPAFSSASRVDLPLDEERTPRPVRTVFHFLSTTKAPRELYSAS